MGSENPCFGCERNCCVDFKVALQQTDPEKYRILLREFPFIHITGEELCFFRGHEAVMNIHNCDRKQVDGSCLDHDSVERPQFCHDTGIKGVPHRGCLLQ